MTDRELLAPLSVGGRAPLSGLRVRVEEAFLHCGRSLIRSRLWDTDAQVDRACYPTYRQVLAARLVWVVHPGTRTVDVHSSDGIVTTLAQNDTLASLDVLPGFSCPVSAVLDT